MTPMPDLTPDQHAEKVTAALDGGVPLALREHRLLRRSEAEESLAALLALAKRTEQAESLAQQIRNRAERAEAWAEQAEKERDEAESDWIADTGRLGGLLRDARAERDRLAAALERIEADKHLPAATRKIAREALQPPQEQTNATGSPPR